MSGLESRAAAGAAAELPSGVGGVSVQHNALDLGIAGQDKYFHFQVHNLETSYVVEGHHLGASQGARIEGHT